MEESFGLNWEDAASVVQTEEVVDMDHEILPPGADEFVVNEVTEEVVETTESEQAGVSDGSIMYLTDGNVIVMQQPTSQDEQIVTEEVVTEQWTEGCPEEIIVGSEEAVGEIVEQTTEDCDIPLPADQDEYTAARPYPCDFCSRRFRKKANLMNHMVAHQTDRPHGCNLCGVRYVRKCDLMNHLKIHAFMPEGDGLEEEVIMTEGEFRKKPSKTYIRRKKKRVKDEFDTIEGEEMTASSSRAYSYSEGDMEGESGKGEYQEYHMPAVAEEEEIRYPITDPNKPFVCQHCGVGFAREKALASHARIHGGDSPFECQKCGEMFWDISLMRDHIRNKHGDIEPYDDDEDDDYTSDQEEARYGTFYCSTCGLSFHRQDNLRRHQRIHVKEEFVNEVEFGHICNVCGESFPEALDLLAHAEVHARSPEHRCMICGEMGHDETSVAIHVQEMHGKNLSPNTCMLCGKSCKDRKTLLKHSWEHSKEKVFSCSQCAKTFHNKARLKRHMLSHRSKVVNCDVCGDEFPDGRSLMNHRHSHSNVSGNKFPCRECGKTFGSRSSQQIHIRIHTGERPYGCRFCWKAFADGGTLRKHERIHTGEKPYACAVCPRAFNQRVVLREHIRSHHSGPDPRYSHSMTPYCCAVCSDMFATAQDLILHLIHHCDMNTALKRQPQERPRKYKRRRKLKPHELEMISNRLDPNPLVNMDEHNMSMVEETLAEDPFTVESEEEPVRQKRTTRRPSKKAASPVSPRPSFDSYQELYTNVQTVEPLQDPIAIKSPQSKVKGKKQKSDLSMPSRPKMIHTQKTRVPVDTGDDGRVRHRTRTLVTRTQPTEIKSALGERIRPRTKNVSYHILNPEKLQVATFPEDPQEAVNNLLRETQGEMKTEVMDEIDQQSNGIMYDESELEQPPEVAAEQTVETDVPVPVGIVQVRRKPRRTSRHVISSVRNVRMIKEGMIVSKIKRVNKEHEQQQNEPESILPDIQPMENVYIKQECKENDGVNKSLMEHHLMNMKQEIMDQSPLHELAEISMHHANSHSLYKCEMCSEVFTDRAQLLVHVPIHI